MKLKVDGSRITANLADEGRTDVFVVDVAFRCADGKIMPSIIFGQKPESTVAQAAADMRRVVQMIGATQVIPWTGRPFTLSPSAPDSSVAGHGVRPRSFQSFKKLGVIGRRAHGSH